MMTDHSIQRLAFYTGIAAIALHDKSYVINCVGRMYEMSEDEANAICAEIWHRLCAAGKCAIDEDPYETAVTNGVMPRLRWASIC
jgi:hypothetical protein